MERNDWIFLTAFGCACLCLILAVIAGFFPHAKAEWVMASAAILQAVGVFAAVTLSSSENRKQADRVRMRAYTDLVISTNSIVTRVLVTSGLIRRTIEGGAPSAEEPNPYRAMEQVHIALAAIPAHQLRDFTLITVAIRVKIDVAEALDFLWPKKSKEQPDLGPFDGIDYRTPEEQAEDRAEFVACLHRMIANCHNFQQVVGRVLNENGVRSH